MWTAQEIFKRPKNGAFEGCLKSHLNLPSHVLLFQWSDAIENLVSLSSQDADEWVQTVADLLKELCSKRSISIRREEADDSGSDAFCKSLAAMERLAEKQVSKAEEEDALPRSSLMPHNCCVLGKNALLAQWPGFSLNQGSSSSRDFTLNRRPKSAKDRAELLEKARNQPHLKPGSTVPSSSIPFRTRDVSRRLDTTPLRGVPTKNAVKLAAGFSDQKPSLNNRPALKRQGGAKLIEIEETPQALKKKRKIWEEGERKKKAEEKAEEKKKEKEGRELRRQNQAVERQAAIEAKRAAMHAKAEAQRAEVEERQRQEQHDQEERLSAGGGSGSDSKTPAYAAAILGNRPAAPFGHLANRTSFAPLPLLSAGLPLPPPPSSTPAYAAGLQSVYQQRPSSSSSSSHPPYSRTPAPVAIAMQPSPVIRNAPPSAAVQWTLTQDVMEQAQDIFRTANKLSRPEKALILGFMAGNRDNPCPHMGNVLTIRLSEGVELENDPNLGQIQVAVETFFQMNYATGEWKRLRKVKRPAIVS